MSKQTLKRMVGLLCIVVALTACKEKEEIVDVVRAIKTMTVAEQAASQLRKFPAVVAAVDSSDLSFQVGGQVASVAVDIGDRVEKGQVLAVLDPEPYQLDLDAVRAELVKARDAVSNETAWSAIFAASPAPDVTAPTPSPMVFAVAPYPAETGEMSMQVNLAPGFLLARICVCPPTPHPASSTFEPSGYSVPVCSNSSRMRDCSRSRLVSRDV